MIKKRVKVISVVCVKKKGRVAGKKASMFYFVYALVTVSKRCKACAW
ncbi:hypothetical protein [Campylobacter troglodytis]|nr:hypothetical protein [Campylobacter troglodytis]